MGLSHKKTKLLRDKDRFGYLFVAPFIVGFLLFTIVPIIQSITFSFQNIFYTHTGYTTTFVGWEHYQYMFVKDPTFRLLVLDSLKSMCLQVPLIVLFSFFAAMLLNQKFRGRLLARAIFFLPVIVASSTVLNTDISSIMASSSGGTGIADMAENASTMSQSLQDFFLSLNLPASFIEYIVNGVNGIYDVVIASGVQILLFLAGLQMVTASQLEAARIEGANSWEIFWKITVPIVSPIVLVSTMYTVIDSFTSNGNPVIEAIVQKYSSVEFGMGSSMSWIYILVVFVVIALVYWLLSKLVFYQDER